MDIPIIYCKIYLQTYRHNMTYSVLKVPLNPNQPTNQMGTQLPSPKWGIAPNFRPVPIVAKRLDGLRCHLVCR